MNNSLDISAYLERINYKEPVDVSFDTLRRLHTAHVFNIPFENLDIHLDREISLEPDVLFNKIVLNKRGGYCFELNGFFALVLQEIGFDVRYLMARVMNSSNPYTAIRPKSHQLLLVSIDDRQWIADVGFGGNGLIAPLLLEEGLVEQQFSEKFRLAIDKTYGYLLQCEIQNEWQSLYAFTLEPYLPVDYIAVNYYCSTSPDSIFTQKRICSKPTTKGRILLVDMELKIRNNGKTERAKVRNMGEYTAMLKHHFGIDIRDDLSRHFE